MSYPSQQTADAKSSPDDETGQQTIELSVPRMDCPSCGTKVGNGIDRLSGTVECETRPATGKVVVRFDASTVSRADIVRAIHQAGYDVAGDADEDSDTDDADSDGRNVWRSARAMKTWIAGVFVAIGIILEFIFTGANPQVGTLGATALHGADLSFLAAVAIGGQEVFQGGYYSAKNFSLDIDLLMSIAILGALAASLGFGEALYFEAATLAFLFSVAELLESYSMDRARNSLRELMDLSPDRATVKRDDGEVTVPVSELTIGDVVVVRPGEKIPLDGEVIDGESAVNQAPITGESVPVDKTVGDEVYAGTINEEGYLEVEVTSATGEDTLSRIIEMVEEAEANKTEREQFVQRFSGYYTPVIVGFAVLTTLASPFMLATSWTTAVVYGLTLLVLACPCAFVISTPVSVVSGITSAAKNGVLIKGGSHLEAMGDVDVVVFDKTGTLTKGELAVTDVIPLNDHTEEDVLRCARGLERRSEHPIGNAIVAYADQRDITERSIADFESITGKGVRAELEGVPHFAGKPSMFEELGFDLSHVHAATDGGVVSRTARQLCEKNNCLDLLEETVPELQSEGKTVILVGTEDRLEGVIAVADEVRPEAAETVEKLRQLGVEQTVMLTGDNERTAAAIASEVGIDEFRAELLPEQKVQRIRELVKSGKTVAMVGDGINDAPALATATIGIAMGAAGTDTALETADIALMSDDLSRLPYLYELATSGNRVIRQNIWSSLGIKAGLALAVPTGYVPIWLAVLLGDAGMTVGVTGNAMRLSRLKPSQ